ncbi:tetraspanin-6-like [Notechis scutatus]|uniref:Tetraspanin n=1 Tax=Notechis scutatus TaxID=8663 RepID=A0A6J1TR58_9SAUR|nr:tetraspanin-6-like [Notechis scutatus]
MRAEAIITWKWCIKIALWLTVLLYWVAGFVLIITGVCVQVKLHNAFVILNEAASGIGVTITAIGVLIIIVSGFGAIALFRSSKAMIKMLHQTVSKDLMKILNKYEKNRQATKRVDILQAEYQCCGVKNYTDWQNTTFGLRFSSVPKSCCKMPVESCVTDLNEDIVGINQEGCLLKLKTWTERNISALGGLAILIVFGQVTGILLCYILLKIINEDCGKTEA